MSLKSSNPVSKKSSKSSKSSNPIKSTVTIKEQHTGSYGHTGTDYTFTNTDHVEMNTLRRTILEHLPTFGFHPRLIKIGNNTSVFNNDYMKLRISNIPIQTDLNDRSTMQWFKYDEDVMVKNNSTRYEDQSNNESDDEDGDDDIADMEPSNVDSQDQSSDAMPEPAEGQETDHYNDVINNISMYFEKENNTSSIINVTTDDKCCTFHYKGSRIDNFYKHPMLLVQLQPTHKIRCLAVSKIGTGKMNELWSPVSICCYDQESDDQYTFSIESMGQLQENEIIYRGCTIIGQLMDELDVYLSTNPAIEETQQNHGTITIKDKTLGNHTVGNIVNHYLQSHPNITFSGYKMPHLLENMFQIKYVADGSKTIVNIIDDVLGAVKSKFTMLARQAETL